MNGVEQEAKGYSAHDTYIGRPGIMLERGKWVANADYCELLMAMWDRMESYPFSTEDGGEPQMEWYHSNYGVRTNIYTQNSIARCGYKLNLTNIASTVPRISAILIMTSQIVVA